MEKRTQMSINYGVLDKTTAMLALKRIQHPSGEETELVEIPMRQVNLLDRIFPSKDVKWRYCPSRVVSSREISICGRGGGRGGGGGRGRQKFPSALQD